MILVYANPIEVKYITHTITKVCIGVGAVDLHKLDYMHPDKVVLFGSCGDLGKHRTDVFCTDFSKIISVDSPIHNRERRIYFNDKFDICDMETDLVYDYCMGNNIEFKFYKYIIDRCNHKVMPWGINYFWRIWQHYRMQTRFNEMLKRGEVANV
jgi:nucleoside phosphorylase